MRADYRGGNGPYGLGVHGKVGSGVLFDRRAPSGRVEVRRGGDRMRPLVPGNVQRAGGKGGTGGEKMGVLESSSENSHNAWLENVCHNELPKLSLMVSCLRIHDLRDPRTTRTQVTRQTFRDTFLHVMNSTSYSQDVVKKGMVVELAADQNGSRCIQQLLETSTPDDKEVQPPRRFLISFVCCHIFFYCSTTQLIVVRMHQPHSALVIITPGRS